MKYWRHKIQKTDVPPSDELLEMMGQDGYELVSVIYSDEEHKWLSYYKKFIDPIEIKHERDVPSEPDNSSESDNISLDIGDIPF